ncbi:MAG: amylo-alpha-1,6-glucosidase [Planctomycetota bacterium]
MQTLQETDSAAVISVSTHDKSVEELLNKEWLVTNNRGGYSSSTIIGCNTRRYHGLLVGSLHPPVDRVMALANCLEMVIINGKVFNLSTFEFPDKFAPAGFGGIKQFRRDVGVHFDYQLNKLELTKSVYLCRDSDTVVVVYDFRRVGEAMEFVLRPFVGLRDFHSLQKSYAHICGTQLADGLLIRHDIPGSCELFLNCAGMNFEKDKQWWFNFLYRCDQQRGQGFTEDLWSPGFFKSRIEAPCRIVFRANLSSCNNPEWQKNTDIETIYKDLQSHQESIKRKLSERREAAKGEKRDRQYEMLCLAADDFITKRQAVRNDRTTILAGFPWFADWGRDTFVALPGLLLATGRFDEAKSVLTTFAQAADDGLIPNRFDDHGDTAYFNSIDASLWFINAAFQYLNTSGDSETFVQQLLPTILLIIDSYHNGTEFGIHADDDGLITAGNEETQLTWMDSKYEGQSFTPRYGKAVEVNALWYNDLCSVAEFYAGRDAEAAKHYCSMADKVKAGFCKLFWNEKRSYLNDCVLLNGSVDATVRPNQIFAVSLPFSPLPIQQAKRVVDVVQKELLTAYGLRTLGVKDSRYKGTYTGGQQQRDEAYHQGTVWAYLIGPFVEAYLKVNDFSQKSKRKAAEFIEPLMQHLTEDGCLGQVCEIFDGDAPHRPKGCFAQAWSVAELIRAYQLINS